MYFGGNVNGYKDGSELQFIKFDIGCQEIKISIPVSEILNLKSNILFPF